jgi:hypothetical protein
MNLLGFSGNVQTQKPVPAFSVSAAIKQQIWVLMVGRQDMACGFAVFATLRADFIVGNGSFD